MVAEAVDAGAEALVFSAIDYENNAAAIDAAAAAGVRSSPSTPTWIPPPCRPTSAPTTTPPADGGPGRAGRRGRRADRGHRQL